MHGIAQHFFHRYILSTYAFIILGGVAQAQSATLVTPIAAPMLETSGLIMANDKLVTHNDSGGEAALYQIDSISGNHSRTVDILGAQNIDWEDICADETSIYIADFGNNNGTRTDLKIYKVGLDEFIDESNEAVNAEVIEFNYSDQTDFTSEPFATNYDAEALVSYGDSLYVFTKNWGNNWTNIYAISKNPGTYSANKTDSMNTEGLVTGGAFDPLSNTIVLSGYEGFSNPFIINVTNFSGGPFSQGDILKTYVEIPSGYSVQVEAITFLSSNTIYLTGEENFAGSAGLYRLRLDETNSVSNTLAAESSIYPNPSSHNLNITHSNFHSVSIYNLAGELCLTSKKTPTSIEKLSSGTYIAIIKNRRGKELARETFIVL